MISSILLAGGTHGNELTGVEVINNWQTIESQVDIPKDVEVSAIHVNKAAIEHRVRYLDEDFNRQFDPDRLATNAIKADAELNREQRLAKELNATYGPKSHPQIDLVVDIHNTTSAMGPSIILLTSDEFDLCLARYVKQQMPTAVILVEDQIPYASHPYFCTLGKRGLMLELGAQPQNCLRASIFQESVELLRHLFAFVQLWNEKTAFEQPPTEAFKLLEEIKYPTVDNKKSAMIHPSLDGKDFHPLHKGDPCFLSFSGEVLCWEGETVYPHFIGEAAYNHLNVAFATAKKINY